MKLRIDKLQSGGGVYFSAVANPFSAQALAAQTQTADSSGSSKKKESILSDKMLELITLKGLPNDIRKLMAMVSKFEKSGYSSNSDTLYSIYAYINQAFQQKAGFDKATEAAIKNGAWDEYAVDSRGYLYVMDKNGQVGKIAPSKYNAKSHRALTVGELAQQRQENDFLVDHTDIVTSIANNIGIETINKYIQDIIKEVGSSEDAREAYESVASIVGSSARRPNSAQLAAIQGIADQLDKLGPDAIFKTKTAESARNIQEGFLYILSVLPANMRNQLEGRYVVSLGKAPKAEDIIAMALKANNAIKTNFSIDYDSAINKDAGNSKETPKERRQGTVEMFFNLNLDRGDIQITDPTYKNKYLMKAKGSIIPQLALDNGRGAGSGPLDMILESGGQGMGKYLDSTNIWFGTDKVSQVDLGNILYTGKQVANVWLPTDSAGNLDLYAFLSYEEAEEYIEANHITDPQTKNSIHRQYGSPARYSADGTLDVSNRMGLFLMTHGYTIDDNISSDNTMYRELKGSEEDLVEDQIKQMYKQFKHNKMRDTFDLDWDDIVEVPIFIKIQDNAGLNASYYAGQGSRVPDTTLQLDMVSQMVLSEPSVLINGSSATLYQ